MEIFDDLCLKCSKVERMTFSPGVEEDVSGLVALNASMNSLIDQVLERDFFLSVWKSFLITHKEVGPSARSNMFRLLSGYRVIANYRMCVGDSLETNEQQPNKYLDVALGAFVEVVTEHGEKGGFNIDDLLDVFPAEGFTALVERLCKMDSHRSFLALLSHKRLLELLKLLVRFGRRRSHGHPSQYPGLLPLLETILQLYFKKSHDNDDNLLTLKCNIT